MLPRPSCITQVSGLGEQYFSFPCAGAVLSFSTQEHTLSYFGDSSLPFPWASVTKTAFALSAWIALERGLIDLDDPAPFPVPEANFAALLSHTSGLDFASNQVICPPYRRRIYSNCGPELAGEMLERTSGVAPSKWVCDEVFSPLGMTQTVLAGSVSYGAHGPVCDLIKLAEELACPTLISAQAHSYFTSPYPAGLPGILPGYGYQSDNAWALGVELRAKKFPHWLGQDFSPATFGQFGQSGSFLWVDPVAQVAGVFLGAEPFGSQHREIWPGLTSAMRALEV